MLHIFATVRLVEYILYDKGENNDVKLESVDAVFDELISADRVDSSVITNSLGAPKARKEFPETWIWDTITDGFENTFIYIYLFYIFTNSSVCICIFPTCMQTII